MKAAARDARRIEGGEAEDKYRREEVVRRRRVYFGTHCCRS